MEFLILAGGKGTRLRSVLPNTPKILAPVNGKTFLHFKLKYLDKLGVKKNYFFIKVQIPKNY